MKKQGFIKSSAILLLMIIVTKVLGIMYKVPLTALLGGGGMGHLSAAMSVFTPVFAAAVSGITPAVAKLTAENYALKRFKNLRKTRRIALRIFAAVGTLGFLLLIFTAPLLSKLSSRSGSPAAIVCAAPTLLFCTLMAVEKGYYEGLSDMMPTAVSEIAESAFRLVCGLSLGYGAGKIMGLSAELCAAAAMLGASAAAFFGCIVLFIMTLRRGDGITKKDLQSDPVTDSAAHTAKRLVITAAPIALSAVVNTLSGFIDLLTIPGGLRKAMSAAPHLFDRLCAEGISKAEIPNFVYGSYTALALTIFGFVPTLTAMLSKGLLPDITAAYAANDKERLTGGLSRLISAAALISMPAAAIIMVRPKAVLGFLFGSRVMEIWSCERAFMILGATAVFSGVAAPCFVLLQLLSRPAVGIRIMLVSEAVKLGLNIALIRIPQLGISGAALSTLVSSLITMELCLFKLRKMTGGKLRTSYLLLRPFFASLLFMAAALISPVITAKVLKIGAEGRFGLCATLAISCIVYAAALELLCEMPKNRFRRTFFKKKL